MAALLPFAPLELGSQDLEERSVRQLEELNLKLRLFADDYIAFFQRTSLLAIDGQVRLFACYHHAKLDHRRVLHDQRAIGEGVGSNRRYDKARDIGGENWTAGCERVRGGTGWRGHDQSICLVGSHEDPVHADFKFGDTRHRALVDHDVIERVVDGNALALALHLAVKHGAQAQLATAGVDFRKRARDFVLPDLGEETQPSQVDPQDRN